MFFFFQYSDMNDEMRTEAMELCVTACEKFSANNEVCWAYSFKWMVIGSSWVTTAAFSVRPCTF